MRTDVALIKYNPNDDTVSMPREVWNEVAGFARSHGESDLMIFELKAHDWRDDMGKPNLPNSTWAYTNIEPPPSNPDDE